MKSILILIIKFYKQGISPYIPGACRFTPTCSEYTVECIEKYGVIKGGILAAKRIGRCHPWGGHGHDPVP